MHALLVLTAWFFAFTLPAGSQPARGSARVQLSETGDLSAALGQLRAAPALDTTQVRTLKRRVTRQEQLRVLRQSAELSLLVPPPPAVSTMPQTPLSTTPLQQGIVLTPAKPAYPDGADAGNAVFSFETWCARAGVGHVPVPPGPPQVLQLMQVTDSFFSMLLWLEVRWPEPGPYAITFSMHDPEATVGPRVRLGNTETPVVPNQAQAPDQWTMLVGYQPPADNHEFIYVYPHFVSAFLGYPGQDCFFEPVFSQITIRKL